MADSIFDGGQFHLIRSADLIRSCKLNFRFPINTVKNTVTLLLLPGPDHLLIDPTSSSSLLDGIGNMELTHASIGLPDFMYQLHILILNGISTDLSEPSIPKI